MSYINVLYRGYKKLMYFSLPTKAFYEDILSNSLHTILFEPLLERFQLAWIKF